MYIVSQKKLTKSLIIHW